MHVVTVLFDLKPDHLPSFMTLMKEQARTSLDVEDECLQFDICADPENPHRVFLYEVYTTSEAFEAHLATGHFLAFEARVVDWIKSKTVARLNRISHD